MINERIEEALQPLIGKPLSTWFRAMDLQGFGFGALVQTTNRRGEPVSVEEFSLHIQCGWRIVGPTGIVVGRRDLYYPAGEDPYEGLEEFDYEGPVPNRRDVRLEVLFEERESAPLVVEGCSADNVGGFRLTFCDGFALEVWPDDSLEDEHWRLLPDDEEQPHFVVTGAGIEE